MFITVDRARQCRMYPAGDLDLEDPPRQRRHEQQELEVAQPFRGDARDLAETLGRSPAAESATALLRVMLEGIFGGCFFQWQWSYLQYYQC